MSRDYFWGLVGFKRRKGGGRKEEGAPDLPPCLCLHLCPSHPVHPNSQYQLDHTASVPKVALGCGVDALYSEGGPVYYLPPCLCLHLCPSLCSASQNPLDHTVHCISVPPCASQYHLYPCAMCIPLALQLGPTGAVYFEGGSVNCLHWIYNTFYSGSPSQTVHSNNTQQLDHCI